MFQKVTLLVLAVTVAGLVVHSLGLRAKGSIAPRSALAPWPFRHRWDWIVYGALGLSALGLAVSGLLAAGLRGVSMSGFTLMAHMGFGGLFIVSLTAWVLLWAEQAGHGFVFWGVAVLGFLAGLTAGLAMTPWVGTDGQRLLYEVHRYGSLALAAGFLIHGYCLWSAPKRLSSSGRIE